MKNKHWIFGGVVAAVALTSATTARVSGDSSMHRAPTAAAPSARQQMARMIAETAARSAAQAAKAVIVNGEIDTSNQTASIPVQMQPTMARSNR